MIKAELLWVDDEIDLLKPYILFLEEKGYVMQCVNNGRDAIELCRSKRFDIVFLDEQMPGLSGLETLTELHISYPEMPVVMVTKSEDEGIMNRAIGRKITDYLIKPVNPSQVLMSIKKILEQEERLVEVVTQEYRELFNPLISEIENCRTADDWISVYKKLVSWELKLDRTQHQMREMLAMQKEEANRLFSRFIKGNYERWIIEGRNHVDGDRPVMSTDLFERFVFPFVDKGEKLFFILIDNFRFDQWQVVKDIVDEFFNYREEIYFSILPTATPYARNAIFSGLMPKQLSELFPDYWVEESEEEGKNLNEELFIKSHLERNKRNYRISYHKINRNQEGEKLVSRFQELGKYDLNVLVFNFIDFLSHARTESAMIRELAADESAYRSLTRSWFKHSPLPALLEKIAGKGYKLVLTTDHGSIRVRNGVKVVGDRETGVNLRYKLGKNLGYNPKDLFDIIHPENAGLPAPNMTTRYIFALKDDFFVYPNNSHHYQSYYGDTFQHGGVSMEEMMVPVVVLKPRAKTL
ncbi:PglZ domain-containing protein [Proteiniphilum sp.]|uniref:T9SS response regulator signal transducer PorX n=1 Tax=Proteiniphilum sp. TaxID=1926877 RepID=UPI002B21826D|nr:PglZ domain-containing protein [Proteiniphilum sp.]MEA4918906.1 PglZ domain-containing protein [Proteiniphilum sp.]